LDPDHTYALGELGTLHGRVGGDYRMAFRLLGRAIETGRCDDWLFGNLGIAHASLGDHDQALRIFLTGIEHHPQSPQLHRNLATTDKLMGDDARARDFLQKAQSLEEARAQPGTPPKKSSNAAPADVHMASTASSSCSLPLNMSDRSPIRLLDNILQ
jgi:Flp pilus assembly protein TadD